MNATDLLNQLSKTKPGELEFLQALEEVISSVCPVYQSRKELQEQKVLERLVEPERQIIFRVFWEDDQGQV